MRRASSFLNLLVAWYGLYQASHVIFNLLYFTGRMAWFPPSAPMGWSPQATHLFDVMAAGGLLNALLGLVFVYGYFAQARWCAWLGTLTLTISMYALLVFTYVTIASGAWTGNVGNYLWLYIPFIPVVVLFVFVGVLAVHGKLLVHRVERIQGYWQE